MTLFPCKIIIKKHMENNMCYECPASNIEKKIRSIYTIFIQHWQTNISVKSLMNTYYCFYLLVVPILLLYFFTIILVISLEVLLIYYYCI